MAFTTVKATNIAEGAITTAKISASVSLGVKISNVAIANSTYTVLDDTAVNVGGGYIVITGSGFSNGAQVLIDQTPATSVTFVDSTTIRAQVPSANAATYNLYVVNSDGSTGIRVNGLTYSGTPTWVTASTLDNQAVDVAFNVGLNATGAVSYANTSALPAGTSLLSNGYFYGTVTGIAEETVYNFTVSAIDAENQDSPRTFSVTVTVGPPPGTLWVLGNGGNGALGLNTPPSTDVNSPAQVGSQTWTEIGGNRYSSGAIKADGTLWLWGQSNYGQLGHNNTIDKSSPVQVGSGTNWSFLSSSPNNGNNFAIKSDGTLWGWGRNDGGMIPTQSSSPVQITSSSDWSSVTHTSFSALALKTNGTLWAWGSNSQGLLGQNDAISKNSPTQIGTNANWYQIDAGGSSTGHGSFLAVKTDGTLWLWGSNSYGQLGQNDTVKRSSPTQVGTYTNWSSCSGGTMMFSAAVKTDGTLWLWGRNHYGQLGLNNRTDYTSPKQVGSSTNWSSVDCAHGHVVALKTDGTLWAWGQNVIFGGSTYRSSPVQIGTNTNWILAKGSGYRSFFLKSV